MKNAARVMKNAPKSDNLQSVNNFGARKRIAPPEYALYVRGNRLFSEKMKNVLSLFIKGVDKSLRKL